MILTHRLAQVTFFAAIAAAGFTVEASHAAPQPVRIIELPPVTVVARRVPPQVAATRVAPLPVVVELPRVMVVYRRPTPNETFVAERATRPGRM